MAELRDKVFSMQRQQELLKKMPVIKSAWHKLEQWNMQSTSIKILITGKTGIGKSTLVNSIIGKEIATEGWKLYSETKEVEKYEHEIDDIVVTIWDSPGLQDGTKNEDSYRADIQAKCTDIDLFIYCIQMSEIRLLPNSKDVNAMIKLSTTLGKQIWENSLIALTFANDIVEIAALNTKDIKGYFEEQVCELTQLIRKLLVEEVKLSYDVVASIPIVPASIPEIPILPDAKSNTGESYWLSELWLKALDVTALKAQPALIRINTYRMKSTEEYLGKEKHSMTKIANALPLVFSEQGAKLGRESFGRVGEKMGEQMKTVAEYVGGKGGKAVGATYGEIQSILLMFELSVHFKTTDENDTETRN